MRLQKRLAKSASQVPPVSKATEPSENFSDQQELQIVPNHFDHEDEPNVLTATPCLPSNKVPEINGDEIKEEVTASSSACSVPPHLLKGLFWALFCHLVKYKHIEVNTESFILLAHSKQRCKQVRQHRLIPDVQSTSNRSRNQIIILCFPTRWRQTHKWCYSTLYFVPCLLNIVLFTLVLFNFIHGYACL